MVSLANASTLQNDSSWIETIRKFVTETLKGGARLNSKQLNRLLGVSWRLIQMQPDRGRCAGEELHKLPSPLVVMLLMFKPLQV